MGKSRNVEKNNPMYGKFHSELSKLKMSAALEGKLKSEEHKQKTSIGMKLLRKTHPSYCSQEYREKMSLACMGRTVMEKQKIAIVESNKKRIGEKNPGWKGGSSFLPYNSEFNDKLKAEIRKRDNNQCQLCYTDRNERAFECHHIDGDKQNDDKLNLISMCGRCHKKMLKLGEALVDYFRYKAWVNENLIRGDI